MLRHIKAGPNSGCPSKQVVKHSCKNPTSNLLSHMWILTTSYFIFFHHLIDSDTGSVITDTQSQALVLLTSSCQFSLNHTIWSTMPSREDSRVGCSSRCICMILLQRHIGAVARIGPGSEAPEWGRAPTELGCCCPEASGDRVMLKNRK